MVYQHTKQLEGIGAFGQLGLLGIAPCNAMVVVWGYLANGVARLFRFSYEDAAPTAVIGASNHFEVAIATATILHDFSIRGRKAF